MMEIVRADEALSAYEYELWLDTSRVGPDGEPDPRYLRAYRWGKTPPGGVTLDDYRAAILVEIGRLGTAELTAIATLDEEGYRYMPPAAPSALTATAASSSAVDL